MSYEPSPEVEREDAQKDLRAMLEASRELGPDMDRALVESYLERHHDDQRPAPPQPLAPEEFMPDPVEPGEAPEDSAPYWVNWRGRNAMPIYLLWALSLFVLHGLLIPIALITTVIWLSASRRRARYRSALTPPPSVTQSLLPTTPPAFPPATYGNSGGVQAPLGAGMATELFDVVLVSAGHNRVGVIRVVRESIHLGLREAKMLVDSAPCVLMQGVSRAEASRVWAALQTAGATVQLQARVLPSIPGAAPLPPAAPMPPAAQTPPMPSSPAPADDVALPPQNPAG